MSSLSLWIVFLMADVVCFALTPHERYFKGYRLPGSGLFIAIRYCWKKLQS